MTKTASFIAALLLLGVTTTDASNVGVDFNLQIGTPPPPPPPPRVIVREYEPPHQSIVIEDDVDFIYPSQLGFYVGVGQPYDLFFLNNFYFTFRSGNWYRSPNHRGGWVQVEHRHLPPGLRKHKLDRIRYYRDREYRVYERERDHYRGRHVRSEKGEWKDHRKEDKRHKKDDKRREKEDRKGGGGGHGHSGNNRE